MDAFQVFMLSAFAVGLIMVIVSAFDFPKEKDGNLGERLKELNHSVADADDVILELNDASKAVLKQFEEKYNELLFVYNLIDEKKAELLSLEGGEKGRYEKRTIKKTAEPTSGGTLAYESYAVGQSPALKSRRFGEVAKLKKEGLSVTDIAKHLGIGKGEVQLILDLGRVR